MSINRETKREILVALVVSAVVASIVFGAIAYLGATTDLLS